MTGNRVLGLVLATLLISACGSATAPTDPCADSPDWAGTMCPNAIAVANARLGLLHWPVTSTQFRASLCPPNARCALVLAPHDTWVIFTFSIGDPVMIRIGPPEIANAPPGFLVAGNPESPPEWILEELAKAR
jgi:hypothetical protein